MINLAGRDVLHAWGKFIFTGFGLGLLIGVTLIMAGVYRGMVDDAKVLLDQSSTDLWVVQKNTLGPYAEPSTVPDDLWRSVRSIEGVEAAVNVTYLTMQAERDGESIRVMVAGVSAEGPGTPGWPLHLTAGRHLSRSRYEAVVDRAAGVRLGETIQIRRNYYRVVGMTERNVSANGDPMVYVSLKDAQEIQFLPDNDAIHAQRRRNAANPQINRPGNSDFLSVMDALQTESHAVNAVLVRVKPAYSSAEVAESIRRWTRHTVYDRIQMEDILLGKLIATSAKQIAMFLVILAIVSAAIVAFIIYTLTMDKIREIAVLKLIGTRNRTIAWMIVQQALALGMIGFVVGKVSSSLAAPWFPKHVLMIPPDSVFGLVALLVICLLTSIVAIRLALKVDPATVIS